MSELNPRLLALVEGFEDMRLEAYRCPGGKWTISAGITVYPDGRPVRQGDKLTELEARTLFEDSLRGWRQKVASLLLGQAAHVVDACTSLAWNIGLPAFRSSTCLKRLRDGDLKGAAEALRWWNKATDPETGQKTVLGGLVARREAEADLLLNGWDGTSGPAVTVVEEAPPKLIESRTIWGAAIAFLGVALPFLAENLTFLVGEAQKVGTAADWLQLAGAAGGSAIVVAARFRDWREGKR